MDCTHDALISITDFCDALLTSLFPPNDRFMLNLVCEVYLPYLQANSLAFNAGEDTFSTTLRGHAYNQTTFKYQAKCLQVLRSEFAKLTETDQQNLASLVGREALRVLETSA